MWWKGTDIGFSVIQTSCSNVSSAVDKLSNIRTKSFPWASVSLLVKWDNYIPWKGACDSGMNIYRACGPGLELERCSKHIDLFLTSPFSFKSGNLWQEKTKCNVLWVTNEERKLIVDQDVKTQVDVLEVLSSEIGLVCTFLFALAQAGSSFLWSTLSPMGPFLYSSKAPD